MFRMIGESTCVLVLCNAIRFNVLHPYIRGLDKVPFVDYCSSKVGSVESLDREKTLSVLRRDM